MGDLEHRCCDGVEEKSVASFHSAGGLKALQSVVEDEGRFTSEDDGSDEDPDRFSVTFPGGNASPITGRVSMKTSLFTSFKLLGAKLQMMKKMGNESKLRQVRAVPTPFPRRVARRARSMATA